LNGHTLPFSSKNCNALSTLNTSSALRPIPSSYTCEHRMIPFGSTMYVPRNASPYILSFLSSTNMFKFLLRMVSASDMTGYFKSLIPPRFLGVEIHFSNTCRGSVDTAYSLQFKLFNSSRYSSNPINSVGHTYVNAFGKNNKINQLPLRSPRFRVRLSPDANPFNSWGGIGVRVLP